MNLCECGCGTMVKNRFASGHNVRANHPMFDKHHERESLQKMSKSHMGQIAWNKNKHWSEEAKQKMSLIKLGTHLSEETKQKIRLAKKNKSKSEETKQRMSLAQMGHISYNKGKPMSDVQKKLISEALRESFRRGYFKNGNATHINSSYSKHSICNVGYEVCSSYERDFSDGLYSYDIKHIYEPKRFQLGGGLSYLPDYIIPSLNLYIELKGQMDTKSKIRHELFRRQGYKLLVLGKRFFQRDKLYEKVLKKLKKVMEGDSKRC